MAFPEYIPKVSQVKTTVLPLERVNDEVENDKRCSSKLKQEKGGSSNSIDVIQFAVRMGNH